jgi:hypothetical protein
MLGWWKRWVPFNTKEKPVRGDTNASCNSQRVLLGPAIAGKKLRPPGLGPQLWRSSAIQLLSDDFR